MKISSRYIEAVLIDIGPILLHAKYAAFSSMCDCPDKCTTLPQWVCVLNRCRKCPCIFVPDAEINYNEDMELL